MKENEFQTWFVRTLKRCGAMTFNVHGHGMQAVAWPDVYVVHPRFHGWVELKTERGKLSEMQIDRINMLLDKGVPAIVVAKRNDEFLVEDTDGRAYQNCVLDWNIVKTARPTMVLDALIQGAFVELEYRDKYDVFKTGFPMHLVVDRSGSLGQGSSGTKES